LGFGKGYLELDRDDVAEGRTLWSSESEVDSVDGVLVSLHVRKDGQRDTNLHGLLAFDFLFNRDIDDFNGALCECLLVVECEDTSFLPWPEGFIQDFDLFDERSTWTGFKNSFRLSLDLGSEAVP